MVTNLQRHSMRLNRLLRPLFATAIGVATVVVSAQEEYHVIFEADVTMKTRDGVTLVADIYRPKADGKFPVLIERTPYTRYIYGGIDYGLKAAARLSPPLSTNTTSRRGKRRLKRATASRLIDASSRIAVCGQPPVSTPSIRSGANA